jgi:Icc protein
MRIALITDTHLGDPTTVSHSIDPKKNLELALDSIAEKNADLLVFTGDIAEIEQYEWFFERLALSCPDYKIVLGNHDNHDKAVKYFKHPSAGTAGLYYSHEDALYKYLYLDSSTSHISNEQFAWLAREINTDKSIVVFIHHPILGIDTGMDRIYPLQGRGRITEILQQCTQKVTVFCGHYHMPDSRQDGNVTQYVTPAVSFQVKKNSGQIEIIADHFGYRIIDIEGPCVKTQLYVNRGYGFIEE